MMINDLINKFKYTKSDRRLTDKELDFVNLNKISYNTPEQRTDYKDFKYQSWISDTEYCIFKRGNTIYFVIKGTNNKENLLTDINLFINILDKTFRRDEDKLKQIIKSYKNHTIKISGHSLGGTKCLMLGKKYKNLTGVVFNSYCPKVSTKFIDMINNTPYITKFVNRDDILSNNGIYINRSKCVIVVNRFFKRSLLQNHSINCFLEDCFKY